MDITPLDVEYENGQDEAAGSAGLAPELVVTESSPMTSGSRALGRDSPDGDSPVVPSNEPVQVFGYLQKQGRRLKGWHQRWFEIRGQHMYYYKTNAKKHCLGEIELRICTHVHPTSAATFGHPFELLTSERSHLLAARTLDDMEKWVDCVKRNMGPRGRRKTKKLTKIKKWDSFRNAFTITRHRSPSPHRAAEPMASLPVGTQRTVIASGNKSFFDRFKRARRDNSESPSHLPGGIALRSPEEEKKKDFPRPLSLRAEDMRSSRLQKEVEDPPTAVSVPNTPLTKKREESRDTEIPGLSPSPYSEQTPGSSLGPSPLSSPEHTIVEDRMYSSPPAHASTSVATETEKEAPGEKSPVFAKPKTIAKESSQSKPVPPPRLKKSPSKTSSQQSSTSLVQPQSAAADKEALPEILTQQLVWDEIKEMLEALPEEEEEAVRLFPDTLPPEDEPWMESETPLEQLREFLAVCA